MKDAPAPACDWTSFRECALVVISCQMNASEQGLEDETQKWAWLVYNLACVARCTIPEKMRAIVDLFEVCELINWLSAVNSFDKPYFELKEPLRAHISRQKMDEAFQTAREQGICMSRLWNLTVGGGEREEVDLPILMEMLKSQSWAGSCGNKTLPGSLDHDTCTAEVCCFSSIDSTRVQQLHKCSDANCGDPLLFQSQSSYECTTWWLDDMENSEEVPYVVNPEKHVPYMAISHVWSDGTGGGVQGEGRVNRCLFKYFREIAIELGCKAIWWDTISIPSEKVARQKAIGRIHENFREASHTIIHDQSLALSPSTNGSHSCLALLLSPWFTRAWTALELRMAQRGKVSVIYQHPAHLNDTNRYMLKSLDGDILAEHPAYSSRGHWVASSLVKQLREQQFDNIGDILKVLRTRSTSWPQDLMIVAGLLTEHKPKKIEPDFIALIVRDIVTDLVTVEESFLYHGHATMRHKGAWSWCPFSLLDVQLRLNTDIYQRIYVDEEGAVTGCWKYRTLSKEDADKLQSYSFHISVDWQIRAALAQWEYCLLLQHPSREDSKVLLVVPLDVGVSTINGTDYVVLECQFVGTVCTNLEWGLSYSIAVRLGKLEDEATTKANDLIDKYYDIKGPRLSLVPRGKALESIRNTRRQLAGRV